MKINLGRENYYDIGKKRLKYLLQDLADNFHCFEVLWELTCSTIRKISFIQCYSTRDALDRSLI